MKDAQLETCATSNGGSGYSTDGDIDQRALELNADIHKAGNISENAGDLQSEPSDRAISVGISDVPRYSKLEPSVSISSVGMISNTFCIWSRA